MKYLKLSVLALLSAFVFSCSDDDDAPINSGNATIGFDQTEYTVDEGTASILIPVTLTGDHNGDVKFKVVVDQLHGDKLDVKETVLLTGQDITMPAGVNQVDVEVYMNTRTLKDTPGRYYTLKIASVQGASLAADQVKVNLVESKNPMDALCGTWTMSGDKKPFDFTMSVDPRDEEGKLGLMICETKNFDGQGIPAKWNMKVVGTTLQFKLETTIAEGLNFGKPEWGLCSLRWASFAMSPQGLMLGDGVIAGAWNEEFTEIKYDANDVLGTWIYDQNGVNTQSIMVVYQNVVLKKK